MDDTHIADQLLTAATALAGLVLIFLSNAVIAYESYQTQERRTVRIKYRDRGVIALSSFFCALVSALSSLFYYWIKSPSMIIVAAGFFVASFLLALSTAFISVLDIR